MSELTLGSICWMSRYDPGIRTGGLEWTITNPCLQKKRWPGDCPKGGRAVPSHSITSHPKKASGTYWHFPSMKMVAFARGSKAPAPIAPPHCGFQSFSSLKSKNPSEWWGFGSVYGEWWLFHFAPLCHLGMLTHYQLLKNRLNITFFFFDWLKKEKIWKLRTDIYLQNLTQFINYLSLPETVKEVIRCSQQKWSYKTLLFYFIAIKQ